MTEIKRYEMNHKGLPDFDDKGVWVLYEDHAAIVAEFQEQLSSHSMSAGQADQRKAESDAVRSALGFSADADDVSPSDLVDAISALQEQVRAVAVENGALKASNTHAALCINAAMVEGLLEALAESPDGRLVDLVNRRLLHAYQEVDSPLTEEQLRQMGDAILLEQLKYGTSFISRQSEIIFNQNQRIAELESKTTEAALRDIRAQAIDDFGIYHNFSEKKLIQVEAKKYAERIRAGGSHE